MNSPKYLIVSKSRRSTLQVLEDHAHDSFVSDTLSQLRKSFPDAERISALEWLAFQEDLSISQSATASSEASFLNAKSRNQNIISYSDMHIIIDEKPLVGDVRGFFIHFQNQYYFLHERKSTALDLIKQKIMQSITPS
ncbi:hypothetical protein [Undibacterium oligocarboniphilum]|uniref:Uncharacterized protein n=1 Tax=Undibacterium oligocarboniphilum TaxID=666702 RepID=A0A850QG25_9BURK|nr:hypothetical protein [Undibacterium oligocarboniphilum]MBC3871841.1 hypothetical protein [Undibacterium oligocarboniphilum]NVO79452.1 hypothetical protein [Undibacterium oligocarboniphilum]